MSNIVHHILSLPNWAALLLVFALPALEASAFLGFIFPGEIAVLLGGVLASQGRAELVPVIAAATAGAVIGDAIGYFVGRRYGRRIVERTLGRIPFFRRRLDRDFEKARNYLARRGGSAVFVGRFTAALRVMVPGLAGMAGMPYRTFALYNVLGGVLWATTFVLIGYVAGQDWKRVEHILSRAGLGLLALIVLIGAIVLIGRWIAGHPERVRRVTDRFLDRPWVARLRARFRRPVYFLVNRFRPGGALGLSLTLALALTGGAVYVFGVLIQDVVAHEDLVRIDLPVKHFFDAHRTHGVTTAMQFLTHLGGKEVVIPVALVAGLAWWYRKRTWMPLLMLAAALGGAIALRWGIGELIHRPRPAPPPGLGPYTGVSFPSGHTVQAVACYGMLAALVSSQAHRWRWSVAAWVGAQVVALVLGFSRLYLGAHWLTDVLGAYALGALWLFGLISAVKLVRGGPLVRVERPPGDAPAPPAEKTVQSPAGPP